ncbi:MAG: hypothetical protein ABS49_10480 [Erythrobacter sp. SCN 62-14]|nr:MAG: hypothetical protein ABS49_10480 [Erythrobacter sp. SCN 62-14]
MSRSPREEQDARDRQRFVIMNVARLVGLAMVLLGITITQGVFDLPFVLGAALAVIGLVDFFVLPVVLARAWNRQGR